MQRLSRPPRTQALPFYRAWLDRDLVAKLDERRRRDGFRSRAALLRAVIEGVGVTGDTAERDVSTGQDGTSPGEGPSLQDAVLALGDSNQKLVAIGRNVEQIAKSIRASSGGAKVVEKLMLERSVSEISEHVEVASKLLGKLRPMLKRKSGVSNSSELSKASAEATSRTSHADVRRSTSCCRCRQVHRFEDP
ncbi:MAG: ribbon-helix-helix protein, CopG family [Burkholderiales bacterium]|nr:ribbon-helix-helix protein, CopG family [Burkholderiales bacterium]